MTAPAGPGPHPTITVADRCVPAANFGANSAQALGAAVFEDVRLDTLGEVESTAFRKSHPPTYADVPRLEVYLTETALDQGRDHEPRAALLRR